jgi:hypothetical protein
MDESQLEIYAETIQQDDHKLALELSKYDIDSALVKRFDDLDIRFQALQVQYQVFINTRKIITHGS